MASILDVTPLGALLDFGSKLVDKLIPDPAAKAEAQLELLKLNQTGELAQLTATTDLAKAQIGVNTVEAGSTSTFVAGGRPFVIWVGGFGLAYAAILEPLLRFIAAVGFHYTGAFPAIDTTITMQVLFGVLGLGALRSYDKKTGP
jgi:Holin of 3TMs, for gene-transfer release